MDSEWLDNLLGVIGSFFVRDSNFLVLPTSLFASNNPVIKTWTSGPDDLLAHTILLCKQGTSGPDGGWNHNIIL